MSGSAEAGNERRSPDIIVRNGRPAAVILDIDEYERVLERLEDLEDLETLREMRQRPLEFRTLEEFLAEYHPRV